MVAVRPATIDDIASMQAVEDDAGERFRAFADPRISRCADDPSYDTDELLDAIGHARAWVAVDESGTVIGFAVACEVDGEAHLDELAVARAHGGYGIGRVLVEEIVGWTRARGFASITLTTFRDVPFNAPYYERLDFHVVMTMTDGLQALVDAQAARGLDPAVRVVMRRVL